MKMEIVIDTLLVIFAVMALLVANLAGYAIASRKMLTVNVKVTRTIWLMCSVLVTLAPFFIPIKIDTLEQMRNMKFGFPAYFVEQHFSAISIDKVFPFYTTLANGFGYSLRSAINLNPLRYIIDVLVCYLICGFAVRLSRKILYRADDKLEIWQG